MKTFPNFSLNFGQNFRNFSLKFSQNFRNFLLNPWQKIFQTSLLKSIYFERRTFSKNLQNSRKVSHKDREWPELHFSHTAEAECTAKKRSGFWPYTEAEAVCTVNDVMIDQWDKCLLKVFFPIKTLLYLLS